jgi:hypothetical protein
MKRSIAVVLAIAITASVGWVLVARSAGRSKTISLAAPAFSPRDYSEHNRAGDTICAEFAESVTGGEVRGDMDNAKGSFFHTVPLPHRVRVTKLRLIVNDNDENDVFAYLIRRRIVHGTPNTEGYKVMARANSTWAVLNTLRTFTDDSIQGDILTDTRQFMYFIELVDCGLPEPYAVQVIYKKP